jgi:hypothetical protein
MEIFSFIKIIVMIVGFVIGLGAVTVIDIHGFLARKSNYWTLATTRTHKITKPMIWVGIFLVLIGGLINYSGSILITHLVLSLILIINGIFLSFVISPFLLKREREGMESELLSKDIQKKITISFVVSIIGWWLSVIIFTLQII